MLLLTTRDLLMIAPAAFDYVLDVAHFVTMSEDGELDGHVLMSEDASFDAAGVDTGDVAFVDDEPLLIDAVVDDSTLSVASPRHVDDAFALAFDPASELSVQVVRLNDLIEPAQAWLLGLLGVDAGESAQAASLAAVLNPDVLKPAIAWRVATRIVTEAWAGDPDDATLIARLDLFRRRAIQAREQVRLRLDLTGDGRPDAIRRAGIINLLRT